MALSEYLLTLSGTLSYEHLLYDSPSPLQYPQRIHVPRLLIPDYILHSTNRVPKDFESRISFSRLSISNASEASG